LERIDAELRETRIAIGRLSPGSHVAPHSPWAPRVLGETSESAEQNSAEALDQAAGRLAELQRLKGTHQSILSRRRRLSELGYRFLEIQRHLSAERQNWCQLLREVGLDETVKINEALESWQRLIEAHDRLQTWKVALVEHKQLEHFSQSFRAR